MSYYVRVDGLLSIDPPLEWHEIKNSPFLPGPPSGRPPARAVDRSGYTEEPDIKLVVESDTVDTDQGELIRKSASTVVPSWDEDYQPARLVEDVQELIDAYPGRTLTGRFNCAGERNGDLWRVEIRDGRAVKVTAAVVWPDQLEPSRSELAAALARLSVSPTHARHETAEVANKARELLADLAGLLNRAG